MTAPATLHTNTAILTDPTETEIAAAMAAVQRVGARTVDAAALGVVGTAVTLAAAALAYGDPAAAAEELRRARAAQVAVRRLLEAPTAVRA